MNRRQEPSELSRLLRLGDPARGEPGMEGAEARTIRAAMLEEKARAPRRRTWSAPPLLAAVASIALLAVGTAWWNLVEPVAAPAGLGIVTVVKPEFTRAADLEGFTEVASQPRPAVRRSPQRVSRLSPSSTSRTAETRVARTVEFQTQGGTRVVWVLDPDFSLNPTEARTR